MTIELAGVSNAWRKLYRQSRKYLRFNLHTINHCLLQNMSLWFKSYNDIRFIKVVFYRLDFFILENRVSSKNTLFRLCYF